MNNIQALKALDIIFNNLSVGKNDKKCILIDGNWGIGKTYFIKEYYPNKTSHIGELQFIYVSVFGKESIKDIEKSILLNLIPGFKNVKYDSWGINFAKMFINDIGDKFIGVNVDNYVNSFSIEDVQWNSNEQRIVICIDDIERKSDSVEMKSLMGLIERASINFDIIIIGNIQEVYKDDKSIFIKYKEKVIDHIIELNRLEKSMLHSIVKDINIENKDKIIDIYLSNNIAFGKARYSEKEYMVEKIYNLRVFIKYIELVIRVKRLLGEEAINVEILKLCKAVIYDYYFPDQLQGKKKSMNFDKYNIYKTINRVLLNEEIKVEEFREYLIANSEVKKDVMKIYNSYMLNESELEKLINKIEIKSRNKNVEYFINQKNVVSVYSALYELAENEISIEESLLETAIDLYDEELGVSHIKIDHSYWDDVDEYGNEIDCKKTVKNFIEKVNEKSKMKFEKYMQGKYHSAIITRNYDEVLLLLKFNELQNKDDFIRIFEYYFEQLTVLYSEDVIRKIQSLLDSTKSEIAMNFLKERKFSEKSITVCKKLKYLSEYLDRKMEYEAQIEYNRNHPFED